MGISRFKVSRLLAVWLAFLGVMALTACVVEDDSPTLAESQYEERVEVAYGFWREAGGLWEEATEWNNPAVLDVEAKLSAGLMSQAIGIWQGTTPISEAEAYHRFVLAAMRHEEAWFLALEEYYQLGLATPYSAVRADELKRLLAELSMEKDKALAAAQASTP